MSWFGETFGDSLNSLKGQITKITKEVLAEDAATSSNKQESQTLLVRELEALSESKDLEIASLKDELEKLQNEFQSKVLNNSKEGGTNNVIYDNDDFKITKLENELLELRQDRDHLNSCLDELQSEHEANLNQVLSLVDKYKSEFEELQKEYKAVKCKLEEASINVNSNEGDLSRPQGLSENGETKDIETHNQLKGQISKLLDELQEIKNVNEKIEAEREEIVTENEKLKNKLNEITKENIEIKIKLKLLLNEKKDLLNKCQAMELLETTLLDLKTAKAEAQQKFKNLLKVLDIKTEEESNLNEMIDLLEKNFYKKCNEASTNWKEEIGHLESELKNLKEENRTVQEKLKISLEKESEMEKKHELEISSLKNSLSEMKNQEQDLINHSQTDDVKKLEQEIAQCMNLILMKDKEITNYSMSLHQIEQELKDVKESYMKTEEALEMTKNEKSKLQKEIDNMHNMGLKINKEKNEIEEKLKLVEADKISLYKINAQLKCKSDELEQQVIELTHINEEFKIVQAELQKVTHHKNEVEKKLGELQIENNQLKNNCEYLKAQEIIKESSVADLMKANMHFQDTVAELQTQCNALLHCEKEMEKWKDASITLQIQLEDLTDKKNEIEKECLRLGSELEALKAKDAEIQQLKQTNSNLLKSCNELHEQLEKFQEEQASSAISSELENKNKIQAEIITQLQEENSELKCRIQKFQEELKNQMLQSNNLSTSKEEIQQHRRSRSAADSALFDGQTSETEKNDESTILKQALQQEQAKYQLLQHQFLEISHKEANARKEFERLKQHLIDIEDHYTEETVENEKTINDLKAKLVAAEEQLQNSSTLYTSLKVRDNQHLESLQSQIRMVTAQRDDLQAKLSVAEDEVQKHKASLMSLQIVLEQFQQDKEREIEQSAMRYEQQLELAKARFVTLESEIDGLKEQLTEAKNGLKAASRLGEQLEKKSQQVFELEKNQSHFNSKITELEHSLAVANQANNGKVDKSLIKNLVVGYVLSPNAERKSQVLRIMASVLEFNQEERDKMGVDTNRTGWLSNILHPKGEGPPNNQSLSEAFIRFLENESRPQPQLKLVPEQLQQSVSRTTRSSPKPSGRLSELTLPTFNSSQDNDSSIILKNVLKDS